MFLLRRGNDLDAQRVGLPLVIPAKPPTRHRGPGRNPFGRYHVVSCFLKDNSPHILAT